MRVLAISSAGSSVAAALAPPPHSVAARPLSLWHSPVPYILGGIAVTIGLITIALLILAYSYWKLFGDLDPVAPAAAGHEEQLLVIMPRDRIPFALANPIDSRAAAESNTDKIPGCDKEAPKQRAHLSRSEERI